MCVCSSGFAPHTHPPTIQPTALDLSYNRLLRLPDVDKCFAGSIRLETLKLDHNHITHLTDEVGQLTRLHTLDLEYNDITALPLEIGAMACLSMLKLKGNKIPSVPSEMACLRSLKTLELSDNKLSRIPPALSTLICLESLDVSRNALGSTPLSATIGLIPNLTELRLTGNSIKALSKRPARIQFITHTSHGAPRAYR